MWLKKIIKYWGFGKKFTKFTDFEAVIFAVEKVYITLRLNVYIIL